MMTYLLIVLLTPLVAFWGLFLWQKRAQTVSGMASHTAFGLALLGSVLLLAHLDQNFIWAFRWIEFIQLQMGFFTGNLEALMLVLVLGIALLVSVFSGVYMGKERNKSKYFAYLQLFTFAMLALVASSNLLQTYIFWEIVGFTSYLLIGFWQERPEAVWASRKAFLVNRVGDIGFLIGIIFVFLEFKTFDFEVISGLFRQVSPSNIHQWIGICIFLGAMAKSAQFPLHIWLPNAMEGPTPISALIHAATMVAAGVFLTAKMSFLFLPETRVFIMAIGGISMLLGAYFAVFQKDIKKVLAYSTISQLGLMMLGLGAGAYEASILHLVIHACFKAGLFLCAGAIIHQLHQVEKKYHLHFDAQNMHFMGGLRHKMPFLFWIYTICMLALVGIPFFSGFLSKDAILIILAEQAHKGLISWVWLAIALVSSLLTAFYIAKQWYLVFFGTFRLEEQHHLSIEFPKIPFAFLIPLFILALGSLGITFSFNPFAAEQSWLWQWIQKRPYTPSVLHTQIALIATSVSVVGLFLGFWRKTSPIITAILAVSWKVPAFLANLVRIVYAKIQIKRSKSLAAWNNHQKLYEGQYIKEVSMAVKPIFWLATLSMLLERFLDSFVNVVPKAKVVTAHIIAWLDKSLVDGLINMCLYLGKLLGNGLRQLQGRHIQAYFGAILGILLVFMFMLKYWMQ
jgi:NADH-quinone oxidoreductase subunit L